MGNFKFLIGLTCVLFVVETTKGLLCYQCADVSGNLTNPDSVKCQTDYAGLVYTSQNPLNKDVKYLQDCTDSNNVFDRCMIEEVWDWTKGEQKLFHRGCHDGKTFKSYDHPRFQNLKTNNDSTCASLPGLFVCYRFCNVDFCNGPCDFDELTNNGTCGKSKATSVFTMTSLNVAVTALAISALLVHM